MYEVPLTHEQRLFATKNHNLVYKFLNEYHLPEEEFYDVIIFGYLNAVRRYLTITSLQQYSFNTIAWKGMLGELNNHNRTNGYQKRKAETVSLHSVSYNDGCLLEDSLLAPDNLMLQLETELLLHDLAKHLSKQQMEMIRLRNSGYGIRDVARSQNLSLQHAKELLEEVRLILLKLCNE